MYCSHSNKMIDLQQYRIVVGNFYLRIPNYHAFRVKGNLKMYINAIGIEVILCVILLLLCGDIEINPGPKGMKICPECKSFVSNRQKNCKCGFSFKTRNGRPVGTTRTAGFNVSKGRPIGTTQDAGYNFTGGRPIGTTLDAGFNASGGRPIGTTLDAGFNASGGRPIGTTHDAGFNASGG